ncbi:MAG TPA: peptide-methionine (S)-S-oxide reductase MsrA [Candidatus Polarisedimenticolaceae bacterium]|nr:peptide-methionine (S)-S-oxide reductase MsrA [Candidatus Polarisedimenticolaceae bacterium]
METITLGAGCFWCTEASYQMIKGVTKVESGYAGGSVPHPSYEAVYSGKTGHAEVAQVTFDPKVVSLDDILNVFWTVHDPTTLNRQGSDVGIAYRSIILYNSEEQRRTAEKSKQKVGSLWPDPIVTEIVPLTDFYRAEEHHQNYYRNNPNQRYCELIINPKLQKLRETFASKLVDSN